MRSIVITLAANLLATLLTLATGVESAMADTPTLPSANNEPITNRLTRHAREMILVHPISGLYLGLWGITKQHGVPTFPGDPWSYTRSPAPLILIVTQWEAIEHMIAYGHADYYLWLFNKSIRLTRRPWQSLPAF